MEILRFFEFYPAILMHDFLRYLIPASLAWLFFWVILKNRLFHRIIQLKKQHQKKIWFEIKYSLSTVLIFSMVGLLIVNFEKAGLTQIYEDIGTYGWIWFVLSFPILIVLHDAYFYWIHRLMHHPLLFEHVHLIHHRSNNPSPWAAYAFHPIEALLEAGIYFLIVFLIPAHPIILFSFLVMMILRNVLSHLGIELFSQKFIKNKWINWNLTTTHHDLHHKKSNVNYGLYFTWWDRWMSTEDNHYADTFESITNRKMVDRKGISAIDITTLIIVFILLLGQSLIGQKLEGLWQLQNESTGHPIANIRISGTSDDFSGKVEQIFLQPWEGIDGVCFLCPKPFKDQKIIGMAILFDFSLDGKNGKIIDPTRGTIYDAKIWKEEPDKLKVRGYTGPFNAFYRTQTWQRQGKEDPTNPFLGKWLTIDDESGKVKAEVQIEKKGNSLQGVIIRRFLNDAEITDPKCTECTGKQANQKILGMEILWGFKHKGKHKWDDGKIFDPDNGKTYDGKLWLEGANTLKVRGYLGPFYRTQTWTRINQSSSSNFSQSN